MSYILEALKKAEKKRGKNTPPDLQKLLGPSEAKARSGYRERWQKFFVLVLTGNLLLFAVHMVSRGVERSEHRLDQEVRMSLADTATGEGLLKSQDRPGPVASKIDSGDHYVEVSNGSNTQFSAPDNPPPIAGEHVSKSSISNPSSSPLIVEDLGKLPENIRSLIPEMSMALHFYSPDSTVRMVRINGQNLREGNRLSTDIRLAEITPQGAIFEVNGYFFRSPKSRIGGR